MDTVNVFRTPTPAGRITGEWHQFRIDLGHYVWNRICIIIEECILKKFVFKTGYSKYVFNTHNKEQGSEKSALFVTCNASKSKGRTNND